MGWVMGLEPTNAGTTTRCVNHFATPTIRNEILVRLERFEPPTTCLEGRCSIQLSYRRILMGQLKLPGLQLQPYQGKIRCHTDYGPCTLALTANTNFGHRTSYFNKMVGAEGFEPPASCSQGRRATKLRYTPIW